MSHKKSNNSHFTSHRENKKKNSPASDVPQPKKYKIEKSSFDGKLVVLNQCQGQHNDGSSSHTYHTNGSYMYPYLYDTNGSLQDDVFARIPHPPATQKEREEFYRARMERTLNEIEKKFEGGK